ncbi:Acetyltransferase (GNAT) family protein [Roseovarius sp. THAF9]|uniref:GNAT family N-acetyltransferase n=1 Tax=Roseovarius sp. THAF9 TaxID=2587847 RepID=UPI001268B17C|nr:GNAT family N-acetyltransferase [Roseovarius sp. THAF9]QFT93972.1 Acetyltransferase (GNAT) family protein [Roseovarius sp. THAF9]
MSSASAGAWVLTLPGYTLVPAEARHTAFLKQLFMACERQKMGALPLSEPDLARLLEPQFAARCAQYARDWPGASDLILTEGPEPIGRFLVDFSADPVHAVDAAILPAFQGRGVGTLMFRALCDEAAARGRDVTLSTLDGRRPERLYRRLGFVVQARPAPYVSMIWTPARQTA